MTFFHDTKFGSEIHLLTISEVLKMIDIIKITIIIKILGIMARFFSVPRYQVDDLKIIKEVRRLYNVRMF